VCSALNAGAVLMADRYTAARINEIAAHNDQARRAMFFCCDVFESPGFRTLSLDDRQKIRALTETYEAWEFDSDCDAEHNFGVVCKGSDGIWKTGREHRDGAVLVVHWTIEYFDSIQRTRLSKAPWDAKVTWRLLTFMLAQEN
jgi:hypothetical protein